MTTSGKIYFASDLHLGTPDGTTSLQREKLFVQWLEEVRKDASEIFLVGDTFDFWHEYKTVVPKGYVRLQGKLAEIADSGIPIHLFTGNHDLWMFGYLEKELGVILHKQPVEREFAGKRFFIGHGDGLGPKDYGYKLMKKVFANRLCQFAFRWLHPDWGTKLAMYLSRKSRYSNEGVHQLEKFRGEEEEWLIQYCKRKLQQQQYDYFIFGHRHLPLDITLNDKSRYINTGDWLDYNSYAVFDGDKLELKYFQKAGNAV